jgi:hypothetical protein
MRPKQYYVPGVNNSFMHWLNVDAVANQLSGLLFIRDANKRLLK